jgi:hypothetical protein
MPAEGTEHSRGITGRGIESRETDNRNLDRSQITDSSYDDAALRQELADALNVSPDDPQVSQALIDAQIRLAAQRALDAQAASPSAAPGPGETAAGRAAVASAAPDNPYAGLTMDQIYSQPWKFETVEKNPSGATITLHHEYIPDPSAPIGTGIVTKTTSIPGFTTTVETTVAAPGRPTTLYLQQYDKNGDLTSSRRTSSVDFVTVPVRDANGDPVVPDVHAGIPGASPSGASGQTTPTPGPSGTPSSPDPQSVGTSVHEVGRTYVGGDTFYQETWTQNPDGTTTYTWTRTRGGVTETATTDQNLTSLSDVTQLTFGYGQ